MKQIISFSKDVVFNDNVASIVSVSLEHNWKVLNKEIEGDFIVFGKYKKHSDTTETEDFKFKLPFMTLVPDNILEDTLKVDISNFTYEMIEDDVLKVNIDYYIEGDEVVNEDYREEIIPFEDELTFLNDKVMDIPVLDGSVEEDKDEINKEVVLLDNDKEEDKQDELDEEVLDEYVTYHIHIVSDVDTIESVATKYECSVDLIKEYNDVNDFKSGCKILIPDYKDE